MSAVIFYFIAFWGIKQSSVFMLKIFTLHLSGFLFSGLWAQEVITRWNFDGSPNPVLGQGTAMHVGGTSKHSATLASGWRVSGFPAQFNASGTVGVGFMVSTAGFEDIQLSFSHYVFNAMSRWAEIQYTLDGRDRWQVWAHHQGACRQESSFILSSLTSHLWWEPTTNRFLGCVSYVFFHKRLLILAYPMKALLLIPPIIAPGCWEAIPIRAMATGN